MILKRMWTNGPLREWSEARERGNQLALASGGYGGAYICDECHESAHMGVYLFENRWICGGCRNKLRPKMEQPVQLRRKNAQNHTPSPQERASHGVE